jgi:hypothetical protein
MALAACTEYGLDGRGDGALGPDATAGSDVDGTGEQDGEWCNGIDDDGDGLVDEGFPDTDLDGLADCMDGECTVDERPGGSCAIDATCTGEVALVDDPWHLVVEWQWSGTPSDVLTTPVVGNLTDDDGDGRIGPADIPDVVVVARDGDGAELVVLDGATGTELWTRSGWAATGGLVLADLTGDGVADIVGFDAEMYPRAVTHDGQALWRGTRAAHTPYPVPTVADLDADGRPEVIADTLILQGSSGELDHDLPIAEVIRYRMPAVADLDLDGRQEVIVGNTAFSSDGIPLWSVDIAGTYGHWAAILDTDGDAEAEVAFIGDGTLLIVEHDGAEQVRVAARADRPGAPCVADFDGDGEAEITWASDNVLSSYELDGTLAWSVAVDDSSGLAACSGFDFDGDGAIEVVYADQQTLYVRDGATGAARASIGGHASSTLWEYPAIADVDRDGAAEIVLASNNATYGGWTGVTVIGHGGDAWPRSGPTWHSHDFSVTNINPDGSVPAWPEPSWQAYNVYRTRPAVDARGVDLQIAIVDVCYAGCAADSAARISVQAFNTGTASSKPMVPIALYARYGGALELVAVDVLPEPVGAGRSSDTVTLEVTVGQAGPDGWLVRVDDTGQGDGIEVECDETNNDGPWGDVPC